MLRKALKISKPVPLVSGEVPRFHGGSLWHSTPVLISAQHLQVSGKAIEFANQQPQFVEITHKSLFSMDKV